MPLETDGVKLDELTSDPGTPENGEVWLNSTDGDVKVQISGSAQTMLTSQDQIHNSIDLVFGSSGSDQEPPWLRVASGGNMILRRFIFKGTNILGTPTAIKAIVEMDSGVTGRVTVYDLTNANQIAQVSSTATTPTILDLGTLSNIPAAEAILEIQLERTAGNAKAKIGSLSIYF